MNGIDWAAEWERADWGLIANRAGHHLFMDAGFLLFVILMLIWIQRRSWTPTLPAFWFFVVAILITIFGAWIREPFDVAGGQGVIKVVTDWISHLAVVLWAWCLYRLSPALAAISQELAEWRKK